MSSAGISGHQKQFTLLHVCPVYTFSDPLFRVFFFSPFFMSFTALDPRMTAELVCNLADHVKVETAGVSKLAEWLSKKFTSGEYSLGNWKQHELHPKQADQVAIEWIFLVDSLNFSFWTPSERYDLNSIFLGMNEIHTNHCTTVIFSFFQLQVQVILVT